MLFSFECCAFLESWAKASKAAYIPNATRSRCFAASICRFSEYTLWVLVIFNIDAHHSAIRCPLWPEMWCCQRLSETEWFKCFLRWHLMIRFGSYLASKRAAWWVCLATIYIRTHACVGVLFCILHYLWHDRPHSTNVCSPHDIGRESWEWDGQEAVIWQAPIPPKGGSIPHEGKRGDAWVKWLLLLLLLLLLLNVIVS